MIEERMKELNPAQHRAVAQIEGPSLIIAGAGAGKTKVLTYRIANMLERGIPPYQILALTFTNKAAKEMKERIASLVGSENVSWLWMGTFHSVFARILRSEASLLGYPSHFTIYDKADSKSALKACLKELNLEEKAYPLNEVMGRISMAKNELYSAVGYAAHPQWVYEDRAARKPRIADIYALYAHKCKVAGAMDFDDLLLFTALLFKEHPEVLEKYRDRFRYILVDEYQDTNRVQYHIIKSLAVKHRNLAVVGDDSQSIYAFRGARIENILHFEKDFPEMQLHKLEQNYRSTQTLVDAANSLIAHNQHRLPKQCFSQAARGEKIEVLKAFSETDEAALVVRSILARTYAGGATYGQFAILYRTNAQSRVLEEVLRKHNIPYKVYGGFSFYERAEVKDFMAYLRLVVNPRDDEAFKRAINTPTRGIGAVTVQKLLSAAAFNGLSALHYIWEGDLTAAGINAGTSQKLKAFAQIITQAQEAQKAEGADAYSVAIVLAGLSGLLAALQADVSIEGKTKLENVEELLNSIKAFCEGASKEMASEVSRLEEGANTPTLERFLANVALLSQLDQNEEDGAEVEKVNLMTVHAAKGLEFPYVYVVGLEEQLFPSLIASETPSELEEERRLCYVAMTRAKIALTLSYATMRRRWGESAFTKPSRFIKEIDAKYLHYNASGNDREGNLRQGSMFGGSSYGNGYGSGYGNRSYGGGGRSYGAGDRSYGNRQFGKREEPLKPVEPLRPQFSRPVTSQNEKVPFVPSGTDDLAPGMQVEHDRFGKGRVLSVEGTPPNRKAVIDFQVGGAKTLLLKYAKLRLL